MENINVTSIESGILYGTPKKVKISKWEQLVKNSEEINRKKEENQFNTKIKPEWELIGISDSIVKATNAAKPIRIVSEGKNRAEEKWSGFRKKDLYDELQDSYNYELGDENISSQLEDYYPNQSFLYAADEVFGNNNDIKDEKKEDYFAADENKETKDNDYSQLEEVIKKALDETAEKEVPQSYDNKDSEMDLAELEAMVSAALNTSHIDDYAEDKDSYYSASDNSELAQLMQRIADLSAEEESIDKTNNQLDNDINGLKGIVNGIKSEKETMLKVSIANANKIAALKEARIKSKYQTQEAKKAQKKELKETWFAEDAEDSKIKKHEEDIRKMLEELENQSDKYNDNQFGMMK